MSPVPRRILLTFLLSLHLIGNLAAIPIAHSIQAGDGSGFTLFALYGVLLGQMSILAAYSAWGLGHWVVRLLKSSFVVVMVWYAITVGAVSTGDSFEVSSIEQLLAIVVALSFLFVSIPHWAIQAFGRHRFQLVGSGQVMADSPKPRFRIVHLLKWTTAAAIVCAIFQSRIGREVWGSEWSVSSGDWWMICLWLSLFATLSVLLAMPAAWACLSEGRPAARLVGVVIYAAVVAASEWTILCWVTGENRLGVFVAGLNIGVLCEVVSCALLLRIAGFRFIGLRL
jgi:hypothetical protein